MWWMYVVTYGGAVVVGWAVAKFLVWTVERSVNRA